ncbi:ATP-binding protein [Parafilimonas sp.]|uniref:HAMP domain-containing sensor histidine kinase n=1 Tax=Parafilimonas sp. TaxID=1969739 RepID=UPI0039E368ED
MALTVKKKIWYGTLFLFVLLILTGVSGMYYLGRLKDESKNVLQDNYESLAYCHSMQNALNNVEAGIEKSKDSFELNLQKQEANITEPGEKKVTSSLRSSFSRIKNGDTVKQNFRLVEMQLQQILQLNMQAIQNKNNIARKTADEAFTVISLLSGLVFLIAFSFLLNFPSVVTKPILQFTEAIKEVSNKNYAHRIHIDNKDEFGKLADAFNEMAARLQYFENSNLNRLMFEKSRAESVINSLKDASIGLDKNNVVLFANEQALQLLNIRNEDIIGKNADDVAKHNDLFKFLMENNSSAPFKIVVQNRENYFIKEVIDIAQNETQSKVIVVKNITSFKELDEAKTNFIATVSHELKTPLAASDFSLKLLEDGRTGSLSGEQKELIENLKQDNQRMLKILSELLNMSQVEAGRIQLNIKQVNPKNIIENAVHAVETNAKEKNISIKNYVEENLPLINADEDKTTWVLNNFLTNAIKYSPEDAMIEASVYKKDNTIIFSVKDRGKGIAQEYQSRIFDRYFKVPGSNEKGTGLGLAISKDFIEAQGGAVWVESEPDKGAVFSFSLVTNQLQ